MAGLVAYLTIRRIVSLNVRVTLVHSDNPGFRVSIAPESIERCPILQGYTEPVGRLETSGLQRASVVY